MILQYRLSVLEVKKKRCAFDTKLCLEGKEKRGCFPVPALNCVNW